MRPPAFAGGDAGGRGGTPPGVALGAPLSHHHPMHQLHHPPPGIDPDVYMYHYATALAAIQASQAGAVAPLSGPSPAAPFAPPLPPGPPPHRRAEPEMSLIPSFEHVLPVVMFVVFVVFSGSARVLYVR